MRRFFLLTAKILISAGLLFVALRGVNVAALTQRIAQISPVWIGAAVVVTLVQVVLGAARWQIITRQCGVPLTFREVLRYNFIGVFFNQTLPSSIGGDAVRLWLLSRSGAGWLKASYSVLVDRAIGLIAIAVIVVASLPWSYHLINDESGRMALILIDVVAISGGIAFLLMGTLSWRWLQQWWATRHVHGCAVIANKVIFNTRTGPVMTALSLSIHVFAVLIAWCVVRSFDAPVTFAQTFLLIPPIMLITMLPISIAGWGVREASMMVAFGYAGLAPADGLLVSLLFGIANFAAGAIGGLVWVLSSSLTLPREPPPALDEAP
ncbi:MAG: flippase-like domain-containing protein [Xanthobacteraceae bacterium]|nr:MAG: flippase-like domain-containing protein [Xanthobacteraceae bacterium]